MKNKAILRAQKKVILAGYKLVKSGLVARTWGNISCRVDHETFVITPSGRAYETLTPNEIVLVKIDDLSHTGNIKPSSEKGIHAAIYEARPPVNFIIHTHQINASALSSLTHDIEVDKKFQKFLGEKIPLARYALPGSKTLAKNVKEILQNSSAPALIMAFHGVVCCGKDDEQAFAVAQNLEAACHEYLLHACSQTDKKITSLKQVYKAFAKKQEMIDAPTKEELPSSRFLNSIKEKDSFILYYQKLPADKNSKNKNDTMCAEENGKKILQLPLNYFEKNSSLAFATTKKIGKQEKLKIAEFSAEAKVHAAIYNADKKIASIVHTHSDDARALSKHAQPLLPFLDDFAQIVGVSAEHIDKQQIFNKKILAKKIKNRNAFLVYDQGAYTFGREQNDSLEDAQATAMVLQKNCRAFVVSSLLGTGKPIAAWEAWLMRYVYLKKYSQQRKM